VRFSDLDNAVDDRMVEYGRRPFFHFTSRRSVDTGRIPDAASDVWLGGEAALVLGRFSLQGEAAHTWLQRDGADDASGLWGGYLSASYFLTDEQRNYDGESGAFGRVEVGHPVFEGGPGAWEFGARLDYVALNDGGADIKGGEQYSLIAGINWYLNDHIRLMIDYAFPRVFNARNSPGAAASGSGNSINGVGARFQADF
jgi:phosphate-selective porin OprO/OprP